MLVYRVAAIEKNGVITPDDTLSADQFRQCLESADSFIQQRKIAFDLIIVGIQSKLKVIPIVIEPIQLVHKGSGIFAPEDNTVNEIRSESDSADLMYVYGITHVGVLFFYPPQEPFGKIGGDVSSATCADNHSFLD